MSSRSAGGSGPMATVVVVDDERDVADLYSAYLDRHYEIRTAYNGRDALDHIDPTVDVVLLDRRMPDMTGDEVLEEVREQGLDCRVVMVTAVEPDFDIVEMEFDDYLTKPVSREDLKEAVEEQLVLDSYDSRLNEYLRKRAKLRVLENQKSPGELADNDRYNELKVVTESLREDLQSMIDDYDQLDLDAQQLEADVDDDRPG